MSTTWGYGPKQFTAPGESSVIRLDVPHRGQIKSINLQQLDGQAAGNFKIYDSELAANVFAGSSMSSAGAGDDPAVHQIAEVKLIVAGAFQAFDLEIHYINRDGTGTNPVRRLWMLLTHDGGDNTEWALSMTILPAPLNG